MKMTEWIENVVTDWAPILNREIKGVAIWEWTLPFVILLVFGMVFETVLRLVRNRLFGAMRPAIEGPLRFLCMVGALSLAVQAAPELIRKIALVRVSLKLALLVGLAWMIARLLHKAVTSLRVWPQADANSKVLVKNGIRLGVGFVALLAALDTLGISITPLVASLGVGAAAVALGFQETVANFFAGLYLLIDKPVRIGDFVRLESGVEGHVLRIGWRSTRVQQATNNVVVMPNVKVAAAQLVNYDLPTSQTVVSTEVGVSYGSDLEHVEKVILEVARSVLAVHYQGGPFPDPVVRFTVFGDSAITVVAHLKAQRFSETVLVKHTFIKALHRRFKDEKIEIPFPQRVVWPKT